MIVFNNSLPVKSEYSVIWLDFIPYLRIFLSLYSLYELSIIQIWNSTRLLETKMRNIEKRNIEAPLWLKTKQFKSDGSFVLGLRMFT